MIVGRPAVFAEIASGHHQHTSTIVYSFAIVIRTWRQATIISIDHRCRSCPDGFRYRVDRLPRAVGGGVEFWDFHASCIPGSSMVTGAPSHIVIVTLVRMLQKRGVRGVSPCGDTCRNSTSQDCKISFGL